jgi:hypothetical protein
MLPIGRDAVSYPARAHQSGLIGEDDGLDAIAEAELGQDASNMGFDGGL